MVFITNLQFLHTGYMVSGFIRNAQDLMFYKNISCPLRKSIFYFGHFYNYKIFQLFYCSVLLFCEKFCEMFCEKFCFIVL